MEDQKKEDLLNEIIKIGKENILDLDLNSTKFGDIMNKLNKKELEENQKKNHQRCSTSISNEEFTNQMMREINSGGLEKIYELFDDQENEESSNKKHSHSRYPTETFDYFRFSNVNKNKINEFQIDDRKTIDVFDKLHIFDNESLDDSDNENDNGGNNEEDEGDGGLGSIIGMKLEKFNEENDGIILNENSNQLIEELKNENLTKYIKTGTKIDFIEEIEGKVFNLKKNFKELEKYISKLDNNENNNKIQNISENKKSRLIKYDMLSTSNNGELYKELLNNKSTIFTFDKNNNILLGTEKGNIIIYNLNEKKIITKLVNPFNNESKLVQITAMSSDEKYIICAYSNGKIYLFKKDKDKLKTKYTEEITENIITEIKVYSKKKKK